MESISKSREMSDLVNQVNKAEFLKQPKKEIFLKTLQLAEKYLKYQNEEEQKITATTELHEEELNKNHLNRTQGNETQQRNRSRQRQNQEFFNMTSANLSLENEEYYTKASHIDFDHFFATLHNYPLEAQMKNKNQNCDYDQESFSLWNNKRANQRKKGINDREWRRFRKSDFETQHNVRRKSLRIEQIQQKSRLQAQMEELRFFYYCGKYRYDDLFVRLRLSYLKANCDKFQEYEIKTATIPDCLFPGQPSKDAKISKIIERKRGELIKRILKPL